MRIKQPYSYCNTVNSWWKKPSESVLKKILNLNRQQIKQTIGLITGQCNIREHLHKMGIFKDGSSCRLCLEKVTNCTDTRIHNKLHGVLLEGISASVLRVYPIWKQHYLDSENWRAVHEIGNSKLGIQYCWSIIWFCLKIQILET